MVVRDKPIKIFSKLGPKWNQATLMQPGMSRTCRMVREVALPMFYEQNTFIVHDQIALPSQLTAWALAIGSVNRASLKNLYMFRISNETIRLIKKHFIRGELQYYWKIDGQRPFRAMDHLTFHEPERSIRKQRRPEDINPLFVFR